MQAGQPFLRGDGIWSGKRRRRQFAEFAPPQGTQVTGTVAEPTGQVGEVVGNRCLAVGAR